MQTSITAPSRSEIVLWAVLSAITLFVHLVTSTHYGYFHDELYFIACARHLAWGYVDQPPLVAVAAWFSGFFGYSLVVLRLLPAISAALTVWITCAIVREFAGGRFAQLLAGIGVMLLPTYLVLGNTLTTTSFEPFSWTLAAYLLIRIIRNREMPLWPVIGLAVTFGMYGKYTMAMFAATLLVG
ncbi:MAG: glycosyltransferase family 39 protein, partial [Candidatus Baltobacteraceae bacterium]